MPNEITIQNIIADYVRDHQEEITEQFIDINFDDHINCIYESTGKTKLGKAMVDLLEDHKEELHKLVEDRLEYDFDMIIGSIRNIV